MQRKLVFKNTMMQYGFTVARYLFPLLTLPFFARVLGPDAYGVRAYILSFMLFVQSFADFGFNVAGAKEIVLSKDSVVKRNGIITDITMTKFALLIVLLFISMGATSGLAITRDYPMCVFVAFLGIFFNCLIPDFLFMGLESMSVITTRYVISKGIALVFMLLLVRTPDDLLLSILLDSLSSLIAFALSWWKSVKDYGYVPQVPSVCGMLSQVKIAVPFFFSTVSVSLFNSLATLLIGMVGTAYEVACWSLAVTALNAVLSLYNPIANALYPHMVHSHDYRLLRLLLVAGSFCALIGALLMSSLSQVVMLVLGGEEYLAGSGVITLVAPVVFAAYPALILGAPVLGALNCEKELAYSSLSAAVVYVLACGLVFAFSFASLVSLAICRIVAEFALLFFRGAHVWRMMKTREGVQG